MHAVLLFTLWFPSARAEDPVFEESEAAGQKFEEPEASLAAELGGALASGNTDFYTLTSSLHSAYKWRKNKLGLEALGVTGRGIVDADASGNLDDVERAAGRVETARRFEAEGRYDRFFGDKNSLYALAGALHDRFAGYDLRSHEQLGYSRVLVQRPPKPADGPEPTGLDLVGEIGLDYAQENYTDDIDPNYADVLAAREMLGGQYVVSPSFAIQEEIEVFENLLDFEDIRINNTFAVVASVNAKLALKLGHTLVFDNQPVTGFRKTDQAATATLVATIL